MSPNDSFEPKYFRLNGDTDLPRPAAMQTRAAYKPRTSERRRGRTGCCSEPIVLALGFAGALLAVVIVGLSCIGAFFAFLCSGTGLLILRHAEGYAHAHIKTIFIASATGGAVLILVVGFLVGVVILIVHWLREGVSGAAALDWTIVGLVKSALVGVCGQVVGNYVLQGRLPGELDLHLTLKLDGVGYLLVMLGAAARGGVARWGYVQCCASDGNSSDC
ncbi:hypothetical protein POSPLADRAFT_1051988 [Postia placenta MAD-698-R-SB12]|uniref:Uncharacterized protein n=1 Tax=Postia placenta MAD-698-R-SB12 TaxID=670580 RepID=A0A1X6NHN2_9APHY|nr:hypothetical protein POSPLADRAFT_1051988 [Postia placenta MAD-698-R-SB12]OSX67873.1 hypothetical protein POSPLADRAFT_1051988 [Postia placenta MAD-698-R-SB12]